MLATSTTSDYLPLILFVPFFALVVFIFVWVHRKARRIVEDWANENHYKLVDCKCRYFFDTGPFKWWTTSKHQFIYKLNLLNETGRAVVCWARVGGYFGGVIWGNKIEVRWE